MTAKEFVACCAREKDQLVRMYMRDKESAVGTQIDALALPPRKLAALRTVLDGALTDAFYTILLALDGEASLGGIQETYSLRDRKGRELTGGGLEAEAWARFHGPAPRSRRKRRTRKTA